MSLADAGLARLTILVMRFRWERIGEIMLALVALIMAAPVLAVAALAIRIQDGGPLLYRAQRVGRGGRCFAMLKLRTMVVGADALGGRLAPESDPRVTRVGRFLRRYKIDELPQFWNVLRGDMAFVGPRPDTPCGVVRYTPLEASLLAVRPGVTCYASLLFLDEGRLLDSAADPLAHYDAVIRPLKNRLSLLYLQTRSLRVDTAIVALTALALVSPAPALRWLAAMLRVWGAAPDLVALRATQLASLSGESAAIARG